MTPASHELSDVLWIPSDDRIARSHMDRFRRTARPSADNSDELWQWSVDNPGEFWRAVWEYCEVIGDPGERPIEEAAEFWKWRFLPDATLNFAENLLAERQGVNAEAIVALDEDGTSVAHTWDEVRAATASVARFLQGAGAVSATLRPP